MKQEEFITKISETELVWALEKEDGFATASSINYEDDEGDPAEVLCFWSDKSLAVACAKDDWEGYVPVEIMLADFIENWCIGMDNDLIMAGIDFDTELIGDELDPLELILVIGDALKKQDKKISLEKYRSMDDLVSEVNKILEA
jgi:hypothetical protein